MKASGKFHTTYLFPVGPVKCEYVIRHCTIRSGHQSFLIGIILKQECIPVGCILSTAVAYLGGGGCPPRGCLPRGVSAQGGLPV